MAALRALCILVAIAGFFLIGTPLQWLIARLSPGAAHQIPRLFCRSLLGLLKVRVHLDGVPPGDGPTLMVANHLSWIDILALGALRPFCFLAKSEVSRWPILSAFAQVQGTVFVDRQRRRSILPANRAMAQRMLEGRTVLVFPEGTTTDGAEPGPFRSSHFAAARDLLRSTMDLDDVCVQPVAIAYSSRQAAWVGDDDLLPHVWRTLRAPPLECRIIFAQPIAYAADSDRKKVAMQSRLAIVEALRRSRGVEHIGLLPVGIDLGEAQPSGC